MIADFQVPVSCSNCNKLRMLCLSHVGGDTHWNFLLSNPRKVTLEAHLKSTKSVAALIDQTLLKPEATQEDVINLCAQASEHSFATVCVNPHWVRVARERLAGSSVKTCTVVGFPLGANRTETKLSEARVALAEGATELDIVINVGALRSGDAKFVEDEIAQLASVAHSAGALLKVILETCLLNDQQKVAASQAAAAAKADFVKTSTGFSTAGATEADIRLMRATVGPVMGVKASGGIRSFEALRRMVEAGATRIGTSSGVQILSEFQAGLTAVSPAPDGY